MDYYLLKTKFHPFSETFAEMVAMFNLGETILTEAYDTEGDLIRQSGVQSIPSLVAIATIDGKLKCVHECSSPAELPMFISQATEKLAALTE